MTVYLFINMVAVAVLIGYNLLHYKEKKLLLSKASLAAIRHFEAKQKKVLSATGFWVVAEIWIISIVQHTIGVFINPAFGNLVGTGANYYGLLFIQPLLVIALCALVKVDPLAQMDLITPAYPLALIFTKIACYFGGCCRGIPWERGFYNPVSRLIEFPIQILEAAVGLLLFVFIFTCRKKFKKGTVFPIYLMAYSALRFFTEFLRVEPEVFMGLKTYQILCIAGVAVGALEYLAARKYHAWTNRKEEPCHSEEIGQGGNGLD